jgi:hypothetical protein
LTSALVHRRIPLRHAFGQMQSTSPHSISARTRRPATFSPGLRSHARSAAGELSPGSARAYLVGEAATRCFSRRPNPSKPQHARSCTPAVSPKLSDCPRKRGNAPEEDSVASPFSQTVTETGSSQPRIGLSNRSILFTRHRKRLLISRNLRAIRP